MSDRQETESRLIIGGRPVIIKLITNPLIDDVVVTEAKLQASLIENGPFSEDRRVDRGIRDFLIRLGVER